MRRPGGVQRSKLPPERQEHHERQQRCERSGSKQREQHRQSWVHMNGRLRRGWQGGAGQGLFVVVCASREQGTW